MDIPKSEIDNLAKEVLSQSSLTDAMNLIVEKAYGWGKKENVNSLLEDIKAEIESITPKATVRYGKLSTEQTLMIPLDKVIGVIDNHISGKEQI